MVARRLRLAALGMFASQAAFAETAEVKVRRVALAEVGPHLAMSLSFADAFDAELLAQLASGFATTVVLRAYVYPQGKDPLPATLSVATFRVVYDLWEEHYLVQIRDLRGEQNLVMKSRAEALKAVTATSELPIAPLELIPLGTVHFAGIVIEVNPVSRDLFAEVRRWLTRDADAARGDGSYLGSFAAIFVNPKIPEADRVLRFRSQLFYRPKPGGEK